MKVVLWGGGLERERPMKVLAGERDEYAGYQIFSEQKLKH